MSDVSTFTPRFLSAPGHGLAFDARERTIERILPAEAVASPPFEIEPAKERRK
jgi:hypothetical protein